MNFAKVIGTNTEIINFEPQRCVVWREKEQQQQKESHKTQAFLAPNLIRTFNGFFEPKFTFYIVSIITQLLIEKIIMYNT